MHLGRIGIALRGQDKQCLELAGDVGKGDRLELAAPPDRFFVERDRLLGRLTRGGELVQRPLTVKLLNRGDAAGLDVRPQIAPPD